MIERDFGNVNNSVQVLPPPIYKKKRKYDSLDDDPMIIPHLLFVHRFNTMKEAYFHRILFVSVRRWSELRENKKNGTKQKINIKN